MLVGAGGGLFRGEEYRKAGNVFRIELPLQALPVHQLFFALRREPEIDLALRHDPARRNRIHADIVGPKIPRQRTGEAEHRRFRGRIGRHAALADHPRCRAEIDDGTGFSGFHIRQHSLGAEELMLQIDGDPVIPIGGGDLLGLMPFIMGGVVDQNLDRAKRIANAANRGLGRVHITQIADFRMGDPAPITHSFFDLHRGISIEIDEANLGFLAREMLNDRSPNATAAAGDDDRLAFEIGIDRAACHIWLL